MRLDSDVIAWLKADGRGYQTKANWLLRHAMLNFTGEKILASKRVSSGGARPDPREENLLCKWMSIPLSPPEIRYPKS
jgi:hypothetical protein